MAKSLTCWGCQDSIVLVCQSRRDPAMCLGIASQQQGHALRVSSLAVVAQPCRRYQTGQYAERFV